MLMGSVQMSGERLSHLEVCDTCAALETHKLRLLSLRDCRASDDDFASLTKAAGHCKSLYQLNLNLGMLNGVERARQLEKCLIQNRSLTALFIHGSPIGHRGLRHIAHGLSLHPNIVSLDLGDCQLIDDSIPLIADLLPPNGAKKSLKELTLSANPAVTVRGWTRFCIAMAAGCSLRVLNLDYNQVGDHGAACLAVAMAGNNTLQRLDLEGCGLSDRGGKTLLDLIKNYPISLKELVLTDNKISAHLSQDIQDALELANTPITSIRNPLDTHDESARRTNMIASVDNYNSAEFASSAMDPSRTVVLAKRERHVSVGGVKYFNETESETSSSYTGVGSPSTLRDSATQNYDTVSETSSIYTSPFSNMTESDTESNMSAMENSTWSRNASKAVSYSPHSPKHSVTHVSKQGMSKSLDNTRIKPHHRDERAYSSSHASNSRSQEPLGSTSYRPHSSRSTQQPSSRTSHQARKKDNVDDFQDVRYSLSDSHRANKGRNRRLESLQ